ncbi:hypothetical protein SAMN04488056_1328 [Cohaesibacter marisflavi]|uniref:Uncharacterized protein n=2 Tax=Cohaesibacter marisflavi TaxID=655353 RepID=A0A1I5NHX7_9HYPH|nr:hypothetical protein SAMN04488056_1328 [Cohaesibacter marisflavi]
MMQTSILAKLISELEEAAAPFADLNQLTQMALSAKPAEEISSHVELARGIRVDVQPDSKIEFKLEQAQEETGLRLCVEDRADSKWVSINFLVPIAQAKDARYIVSLIDAYSKGMTAFRPCVRYHLEERFIDRFTSPLAVFTDGRTEQFVIHKMEEELLREARNIEIIWFFDGTKFDLSLFAIEHIKV